MSAGPTPIQTWLTSLFELIADARAELNEEAWSSFIYVGCERFGLEAAREIVAEALRATGEASEEAA